MSKDPDGYPPTFPLILAVGSVLFSIGSGLGFYESYTRGRWVNAAITGPGSLFFAYCAVGWARRWRAAKRPPDPPLE
jgi:hypothetical protein